MAAVERSQDAQTAYTLSAHTFDNSTTQQLQSLHDPENAQAQPQIASQQSSAVDHSHSYPCSGLPSQMPSAMAQAQPTPPSNTQATTLDTQLPNLLPEQQAPYARPSPSFESITSNPTNIIPNRVWEDFSTINVLQHLQRQIITSTFIPKAFKHQWRFVCTAVQAAAMSSSPNVSLGAWKAFILLPILLLRIPTGQERDQSTTVKWTARFRKFWSGNLRVLLEESLQSSRQSLISSNHTIPSDTNIEDPDTDSLIPASLLAKAEILAKDGLISKAAAVLNQSPMAPATEETFQRLQQLHPRRARPATSAIPPSQSHTQSNLNIHFYTASIIKSINDAPRKSMPGPSGWRYEHLKWIVHKDFHKDISPLLEMLSAILRS